MSYYNGPTISTSGLIMCYDAGNSKSYTGAGSTWRNLATNGTATIPAGTAFSSSYGASSFYFTGTTSAVSTDIVQNTYFPNTGSDFTMGIALNTPAFYYSGYLGHAQYLEHGFLLGMQSSVHRFVINNSGGQYSIDGPAPAAGTPEILFATFSGRTMKLFYNGSLYSTGTATFDWLPKAVNINIGYANQGGWNQYIGHIYCAMLYNRALTDGEIIRNHNAIKSRFRL